MWATGLDPVVGNFFTHTAGSSSCLLLVITSDLCANLIDEVRMRLSRLESSKQVVMMNVSDVSISSMLTHFVSNEMEHYKK
jgi:hypothetical protein